MYKTHPSFETPNPDTIIWRYLDLWKFLDLLDNKQLYLARADKFEDTFEGRIPLREVRELDETHNLKQLDDFSERAIKKSTYISSWSMESSEMYSLWKIYSDYRSAIAIKSTVGRLIDSVKNDKKDQYVGLVKYINPKPPYTFSGNFFQLFLEKRKYFKFENEVRIIATQLYKDNQELLLLPEGLRLNIDTNVLIDEVYLAPKADKSFKSLIELKLQSLNLNKTVSYSDI